MVLCYQVHHSYGFHLEKAFGLRPAKIAIIAVYAQIWVRLLLLLLLICIIGMMIQSQTLKIASLLLWLLSISDVKGQSKKVDNPTFIKQAVLVNINYKFQVPAADLAKRFGVSSGLGFQLMLKTKKNWLFGTDMTFIFGRTVHDTSVLNNLKDSKGYIFDVTGKPLLVSLAMRGFQADVKVGKLYQVGGKTSNFALGGTLGVGFIQHRIAPTAGLNVVQLNGEYRKGYDRMCNGLALNQFFGLYHLDRWRLINFYAGIDITQGFTQNRRSWDYVLMKADNENRLDIIWGLRAGWILPIYSKKGEVKYYK